MQTNPNELVTLNGGVAVTNSLVIADGTENEHASVIKLVRTYQTQLEKFGRVGFQIDSFATPGGLQSREVAVLNQEQATLLLTLMRNSEVVVAFKVALVAAFFELAHRVQSLNPANLSRLQLITMAMEAEQERLALESKVQVLVPKAEALDRIATRADGALCITDSAKALQVQPKTLFVWMQANAWIYRRAGNKNWLGYQDKVQAGYLEHKISSVPMPDGTEKIREQVLVTAKGLAKLAGFFRTAA